MKLEERMTTKTRYTDEFKAEAIRLVRDSARACCSNSSGPRHRRSSAVTLTG